MQYDGEPGHPLFDLLQDIEAQRRRFLAGFDLELVGPMGGADGDGQAVHPGLPHEFLHLFGPRIMGSLGHHLVFDAGQYPQFGLHRDVEIMGEIHHLAGEGHVFLEGQM